MTGPEPQLSAVLSDGAPDQAGSLSVRIVASRTEISVLPDGYGDSCSAEGQGCPLFLELYEGRLRLVCFPDINEQEPLIVDLERAREAYQTGQP